MTRLLPRRTLLRGAGSALALPLLDAMLPLSRRGLSRAAAQPAAAAGAPRRIIFLLTGNGYYMPDWVCNPASSEDKTFALSPILKPFEAVRDQALFIHGVTNRSGLQGAAVGHPAGAQSQLTGSYAGPGNEYGGSSNNIGMSMHDSLDVILAEKVGANSRFPVYRHAVYLAGRNTLRAYSKNRTAQSMVQSPSQVYNDFFSNFTAPAAGTTGPSPAAAAAIGRRHRMLDASLAEVNKLSGKLDAHSKQRLEEFAANMRDVEQRLDIVSGGESCAKPAQPGSIDINSVSQIPQSTKLHLDLLAMGIACDITRVACFQFNTSGNDPQRPLTYSFLNSNHITDHHNYSHMRENDPVTRLREINVWHNQQIAYFVNKLKNLPEGDGTVLDNTVIFHFSEFGSSQQHSLGDPKYTIFGGGNHFKLGRYVKFDGPNHNRLLLNLMRYMGVNDPTIGLADYCGGGPLAGLTK